MVTEQKQDTQNKKKKIFKILKRIGQILVLGIGILLVLNNCKKTHALEVIEPTPLNYGNYNYIVQIESRYYSAGVTSGNLTIIAAVTPTKINYLTINSDELPDYYCDDADLLSGPYETYGANQILENNYYFVLIQNTNPLEIKAASEFNTYYEWKLATARSNAYASALSDEGVTIYNNGYNDGVNDTADSAHYQLVQQQLTYETQIKDLEQQLANANATISAGGTWANLKNLLSLIFLFPIRFFKEGMDVNIYGVNIGGLILGLFMIGLTLTIIGLILGRRKA